MAIRTNGDSGYVGIPPLNISVAAFATNNYTAVLADKDRFVELNNDAAGTFTVPPNSAVPFPKGAQINLVQTGTGQITLTPGSGVTINSSSGLKFRTQWSEATLVKRGTDLWVVAGDLSA